MNETEDPLTTVVPLQTNHMNQASLYSQIPAPKSGLLPQGGLQTCEGKKYAYA